MSREQKIDSRYERSLKRASLFSMFYRLSSNSISSRGFTILFAVLISSVMLAIGIAIFNITVRELRLSSIVRESQKAVYASDAGAECALYNAFKMHLFDVNTANTFNCNNTNFPLPAGSRPAGDTATIGGSGYSATSTFTVTYGTTCAVVNIATHLIAVGQTRTIIESHGYNPCDPTSVTRVERVYRLIY